MPLLPFREPSSPTNTTAPVNLTSFSNPITSISPINTGTTTAAKNRRLTYLRRHPSYFTSAHHELAHPLLYDRLIRSHQSVAERETEGRKKGWAGRLEADLLRGEARLADVQRARRDGCKSTEAQTDGDGTCYAILWHVDNENDVGRDMTKDEARGRWEYIIQQRFLRGEDDEFDYGDVDGSAEYDDREIEERDAQDLYFAREEPSFVFEDGKERPNGETGVQDF